jgi:hypothetical protein
MEDLLYIEKAHTDSKFRHEYVKLTLCKALKFPFRNSFPPQYSVCLMFYIPPHPSMTFPNGLKPFVTFPTLCDISKTFHQSNVQRALTGLQNFLLQLALCLGAFLAEMENLAHITDSERTGLEEVNQVRSLDRELIFLSRWLLAVHAGIWSE